MFMIFMGKWNRRAQVMTLAEWMQLRFGVGREGNIARIVSAVAAIILTYGRIGYFAIGGGKFLGEFITVDGLDFNYLPSIDLHLVVFPHPNCLSACHPR